MRRLLWKEWHEVKWYIAGLLAIPWMVLLWESYGRSLPPAKLFDTMMIWELVILAFWGGSRMQDSMRPSHLSVQWLPVHRWLALFWELLPGLIVSLLIPLWIRCAAGAVHNSLPDYRNARVDAVSIYALSFAVSTLLPSLAAVLVSVMIRWLLVPAIHNYYTGTYFGYYDSPNGVAEPMWAAGLSVLALSAAIGIWSRPVGAAGRRKATGAAKGVLIGLIPTAAVTALCIAFLANGWSGLSTILDDYRMIEQTRQDYFKRSYYSPVGSTVVSPDGQCVAYMAKTWTTTYKRNRVEVLSLAGNRISVPDPTASPFAWLPNGNLLVCSGLLGQEMAISEFDVRTKRLIRLVSFPSADKWSPPIQQVCPDPSGSRLALLVSSRGAHGYDIWLYDMKTKRLRVLRPGVQYFEADMQWSGSRLIMVRSDCKPVSLQTDALCPRFEPYGKEVR